MNGPVFSLVLVAAAAAACAAQAAESKRAPTPPANRGAAYGPGFVYSAQTGTCVKLGGRGRAEGIARTPGNAGQDSLKLRGEDRLQLDTRTETGAGPLRAVIDVGGRTGRGRP